MTHAYDTRMRYEQRWSAERADWRIVTEEYESHIQLLEKLVAQERCKVRLFEQVACYDVL